MLVLSSEAKELCLDSWALAARALFHSALISMEARYSVCRGTAGTDKRSAEDHPGLFAGRVAFRRLYLLGVRVGVQARHQVEDVAERHRVQVLDERREEVVYVATAVFQLEGGGKKQLVVIYSYLHVFFSGFLLSFSASGCLT